MTLEDRLRQMVSALPSEASIMLPVSVVRDWLEEGDDPLDDYTMADVAAKLSRSEGTIRSWIRSGKLEAYWLGHEYRVTRSAVAAFRLRRRDRPTPVEPISSQSAADADLGAWREVRAAKQ